jgi:hypothetical protein
MRLPVADNVAVLAWKQRLLTLVLAFVGVAGSYALADRRGFAPYILIFLVGLGIGFGTRGGWVAAMVGVVAAHVAVGLVKASTGVEGGRELTSYAGEGLLIGITFFTPGYLFGAAARVRRERQMTATTAAASEPAAAVSASNQWITPRGMVYLGCGILAAVGLLMVYIYWQLTKGGGY